jgi:Derlin-2/3
MGLISFPVVYLPYVMIGMDLLMAGPGAVPSGVSGVVVGHLWWWGVWGGPAAGTPGVLDHYSRAPQWMKKLFGEQGLANVVAPGVGTIGGVHVIPPRRMAAGSSDTSASTTTSGYRWGSGNRLGDR